MKLLELEQNTPEWYALRRKSIGASDCSVLMGNSPWKDEYTLFQEKMGLHTQQVTHAMEEGSRLEPIARESFCTDYRLILTPKVVQSVTRPWQIASLDGYHPDGTILEVKCSHKCYELARHGVVPQYYIDQMQHQLCVTELPMCNYYAFWEGNGVTIEIERDDEYIAKIIEKETEFYRRMVEFDPPEPKHKLRTETGWLYEAEVYQKLCQQENEVKKLKEASKQRLIELAGENSKGGGISLTKVARPGIVRYTHIPAVLAMTPNELEAYREPPVEYWTITKDRSCSSI